jgi:hypothetical protein
VYLGWIKKKLFNSNVQAASLVNISEWIIRKNKKSVAVFKDRLRVY